MIDLEKLQDFSMDKNTWQATIGGGTRLSDVTKRLHDNGKRAISHGTCPGVGIGGHATIVSCTGQFVVMSANAIYDREDWVLRLVCGVLV